MSMKKNERDSIPAAMQAMTDQEREELTQVKREQLQKSLELSRKKLEDEFVKVKLDKELMDSSHTSSDGLINPTQKDNDGEILYKDV